MPGSDASQFTRFKKASAVQGTPIRGDMKSVNHLTQYVSRLSGASSETEFLSSLTNKTTRPIIRPSINTDFIGKQQGLKQNCS
jgi:hypothetical protein